MQVSNEIAQSLGIVVIGRNEGSRLDDCLISILRFNVPTVYVDSGSTDASAVCAEELCVEVLSLDPARPFTASRARREGAEQLLDANPDLRYLFFVDGDCIVDPSWPLLAIESLQGDLSLAAACGRRREQYPERSWYNQLCDFEWDSPVGECNGLGGDGVYRVSAYLEAGGFDPTVPAGEEPELCLRLRNAGWKLRRLDAEMTQHDAAINQFGQWWKRQLRTGYGGRDVERRFGIGLFDKLIRGSYFWAIAYPFVVVATAIVGWFAIGWLGIVVPLALGVTGFALQTFRIARSASAKVESTGAAWRIAWLTILGKIPIAVGAIRSNVGHWRGQQATIVEYKGRGEASEKGIASGASLESQP